MSETKNKRTILVLEDEMPLQHAIKMKLETRNFEVITTRRVVNGLDILNNDGIIDAIWLDHYLLGKEDGFDFVTKIKNSEEWKSIPLFVVSNTASEDKLRAYMRLGINNYYTKADYKLEDIINDVEEAIEDKK